MARGEELKGEPSSVPACQISLKAPPPPPKALPLFPSNSLCLYPYGSDTVQ